MQTYAPQQQPSDIDMEPDSDSAQSSMPKQLQDEVMEFEPCLQVADLQMSATNNLTDVPSVEQSNLQLEQVAESSNDLTGQATQLSTATTTTTLNTSPLGSVVQTSGSMQSGADQDSAKLIMVNPMSKPLFEEESVSSQNQSPKAKSSRQDSLVLVDAASSPKGDDQVFKVLLNNLSPATSCFDHPSVLNEKNSLNVCRCRNTFCDCRLYHCPLCTCLPNKPGRIREHFKKIHAQDLVVRYQGKEKARMRVPLNLVKEMYSVMYQPQIMPKNTS